MYFPTWGVRWLVYWGAVGLPVWGVDLGEWWGEWPDLIGGTEVGERVMGDVETGLCNKFINIIIKLQNNHFLNRHLNKLTVLYGLLFWSSISLSIWPECKGGGGKCTDVRSGRDPVLLDTGICAPFESWLEG